MQKSMQERGIDRVLLVWALAFGLLLLAPADAEAKTPKRWGFEGQVVKFDEAKDTVTIKVGKTKVSGGFGTGGVAGGKPPRSVGLKRGDERDFRVIPEGSVLKRTTVKDIRGAGVDNSGTVEGFKRALAVIPDDRDVVISFEKTDRALVKGGAPEYTIKMIQIRLTEEELQERFDANSVEVD